jgi:hypothetical protein
MPVSTTSRRYADAARELQKPPGKPFRFARRL